MSGNHLLEELKTTTSAVRGQDWITGSLSGASPAGEGQDSNPLASLASAGFGFLTEAVSFLEEPLKQLSGNPGAVSAGAQGLQAAGQAVSAVADSYGQATGSETQGWSGAAASGYLQTGAELVGNIAALGEAGRALSEAVAGAGEVVSRTLQEVTTLVHEATGKIIMIMNQALAAAQATFGASIAAAIPQAIQVATEYGARISAKMQELLGSMQGLMGHVNTTAAAVAKVTDTMAKISSQAASAGSSRTRGSNGGTGLPGGSPGDSLKDLEELGAAGSAAGTSSAGAAAGSGGAARPLSAGGATGIGGSPAGAHGMAALGGAAAAAGAGGMLAGAPRGAGANGSGATEHRNKYRDAAERADGTPPGTGGSRPEDREPPQAYAQR